jgi:hypothetical protein
MSVRKDKDSVTVTDGREAVGNNNTGAAHGVQGVGYLPLCFIIRRAGGFIKDQQLGALEQPLGRS